MLRMTEYKEILRDHGMSGGDMADLLGLTHSSYRTLVGGSKGVPKWVKSFMVGYMLAKKEEKKGFDLEVI